MTSTAFVPILQTAIGPVILISGVGLLILTMTNRLARAIDRARALNHRSGAELERARPQLRILIRRARLLQRAIFMCATSALCAALLVTAIFLSAVFGVSFDALLALLFIAAMGSLIYSLVLFIRDVNLSLAALETDLPPGL